MYRVMDTGSTLYGLRRLVSNIFERHHRIGPQSAFRALTGSSAHQNHHKVSNSRRREGDNPPTGR
jgi:hypothetical protein